MRHSIRQCQNLATGYVATLSTYHLSLTATVDSCGAETKLGYRPNESLSMTNAVEMPMELTASKMQLKLKS